jgi:hypothetical protein
MRFSGPTEGNSAKPFARQPPLPGFGWVGDSLLKGSLSDIAARSSGEIAATERESSDPLSGSGTQPCGTTPRFLLTLSIAIMRSKYHVLFERNHFVAVSTSVHLTRSILSPGAGPPSSPNDS